MEPRPLHPARALAHPLWWIALGALVLNDHLLKGSGLLPGALTGKISDFAGLLVAPALLAAALRGRSRRGLAAAHLATGAVFAAVNLSPAAAAAFEAGMALTPWPWRIWVDPGDLLALPMLAVSWRVFTPAMARPAPLGPTLQRAGAILGGWACVATSPPPEPRGECWEAGADACAAPATQDRLMFGNLTQQPIRLRVRPLRPGVRLDCDAVSADPGGLLAPEVFAPATLWEIAPGRALGLLAAAPDPQIPCPAWWVDGPGLTGRVVFLPQSTWPRTALSSSVVGLPDDRLLPIEVEGFGEHPALYPLTYAAPEPPSPECRLPASGAGVDWGSPPTGEALLAAVDSAPDGCHRLLLEILGWAEPWFVCIGAAPLPFEAGETLRITAGSRPDGQGDWAQLEGARQRLRLQRGPLDHPRLRVDDERLRPCRPTGDRCGQWRSPVELSVVDPGTGERGWLGTGTTLELERARVDLVRAERLAVADTECGPLPAGLAIDTSPLTEWVITEAVRQ